MPPLDSVRGTSMMRWLLEPRKRSEMSCSSSTKRPSTSTSTSESSSSVTSQRGWEPSVCSCSQVKPVKAAESQRVIAVYDVDMNHGRFTEKDRVEITNSSYVTISHNQKYLYSITDFGVEAYRILKDGTLEAINRASINGMRGCYLSTDYDDKFLFVAGYHDAKLTALRVNSDGSVGEITDEIFHRGLGSIAERNFRPHISCVKMTRDNRYLCAADLGMDHIVVYELDHESGRLQQVDIIRSEQESAPRHLKFSKDGRYMYVVHELKNYIDVYHYYIDEHHDSPEFEKIQTISTLYA